MTDTVQIGATTFVKPDETSLIATRAINADRTLVWAAHTECKHVKEWLLGPLGWTMPTCEIDLRPGGAWRYVYEGPDGAGFSMSGEYREIKAPGRVVNTETMDDAPVETLNTLTLDEEGGKTVLRTVVVYPSKELRETIIATGMMDGWAESYDRLERYLQSLK